MERDEKHTSSLDLYVDCNFEQLQFVVDLIDVYSFLNGSVGNQKKN